MKELAGSFRVLNATVDVSILTSADRTFKFMSGYCLRHPQGHGSCLGGSHIGASIIGLDGRTCVKAGQRCEVK